MHVGAIAAKAGKPDDDSADAATGTNAGAPRTALRRTRSSDRRLEL